MDITVLEGRDEWMLDVHKENPKRTDGGVDITLAFVLLKLLGLLDVDDFPGKFH